MRSAVFGRVGRVRRRAAVSELRMSLSRLPSWAVWAPRRGAGRRGVGVRMRSEVFGRVGRVRRRAAVSESRISLSRLPSWAVWAPRRGAGRRGVGMRGLPVRIRSTVFGQVRSHRRRAAGFGVWELRRRWLRWAVWAPRRGAGHRGVGVRVRSAVFGRVRAGRRAVGPVVAGSTGVGPVRPGRVLPG